MDATAVEADDVWAVSISSVLHWDGATWNSEDLSKGNAISLSSKSATAPDYVWVVGERPGLKLGPHLNGWSTLVMHFDGHRWIEQDTPDQGTRDNYLSGVEVEPQERVGCGISERYRTQVAGGNHADHALGWDRRSLAPAPSPSRSSTSSGAWGVSGSTVWALGHHWGADGHLTPLILELSGTGWLQVPLHGDTHWSATAAAGASPGSAWVIGSEPTSSFAVAGLAASRSVER